MTSAELSQHGPIDVGSDREVFDLTNVHLRCDKSQPIASVIFQTDRG